MARGTQLQDLVTMVRAEAGHSTSVAAGVDNLPALCQKIRRTQIMLYDEYDWPFLREDFLINQQNSGHLNAGQRYYDFPIFNFDNSGLSSGYGLDMERIEQVWIDYSGKPQPLTRGIGQEQYAQFNSNSSTPARASPVRRWDIKRTSDGREQIEVWPIPADNTQLMYMRGLRQLRPLIAMADVADLDDVMISLTVASELLAKAKSMDAPKVEAAAAARLKQLKVRTKGASRMITMSGSSAAEGRNKGKTIIRIGSTTN